MYSIMENPMTACGCFECIVMYIPEAEGVMVVSREDPSMTPAGMTFSTLAGMAGGGLQTPGVMGVGKFYLTSPKFISADGGFRRVVWMSSFLKDTMAQEFAAVAEREGIPDLIDRIADERSVTSVDELVDWLEEKEHPVLEMGHMQAASGAPEVEAAAPVPEAEVAAPAPEAEAAAPAPEAEAAAPAPEAVEAAAPEPEVAPEPTGAVTAPLPADADAQAIAQASADIVLDSIRRALVSALQELGGTGAVPADLGRAPAGVPAPVAAPPAEAPPPAAPPVERKARPVVPPWTEDKETSLEIPKEKWTGQVREITLGATQEEGGTRTKTVTLGGQTAMPFLTFEGEMSHRPVLAVEIQDRKPDDWSPLLMDVWGDVMDSPGEWAKAAEKAGADLIVLQLSLQLANGEPNTAENARAVVREVLKATGLPLIVLGPGQVDADNELLVAVAEEGAGERLALGFCEEKNYRTIVARLWTSTWPNNSTS